MLSRGVPRDKIQNHFNTFAMGGIKKFLQVGKASIAGINLAKIGDVITAVFKGRRKAGAQPYTIHAKGFDIIEFANDALQVADAFPIAVCKGGGINLVEDGLTEPEGSFFRVIVVPYKFW
jgi:hypothetical protein